MQACLYANAYQPSFVCTSLVPASIKVARFKSKSDKGLTGMREISEKAQKRKYVVGRHVTSCIVEKRRNTGLDTDTPT